MQPLKTSFLNSSISIPSFDSRVFVAVILAAFNLRLAVTTIGPLIDEIRIDTGMSNSVAGLLNAIPPLCMSVFALVGMRLVRHLGFSRVLWLSLVLITGGTILRAAMAVPTLLVITTFPIGAGLALAGITIPGVVKHYFEGRLGAVTGAYVAAFSVAAAIGALTVVPLSNALGSWHWALAATAIPAVVGLLVWPWLGLKPQDMDRDPVIQPLPRPSRSAIVLGLMFGCQAMCFYAMISWIAAAYVDAGWTAGRAALTTASISVLTIPASLIISSLSDGRDRRRWVAGAAVLFTFGIAGIALAPTSGVVLWLVLFGVGGGAIFPLMLALPLDFGSGALEVTDLSAWMQAIGYAMAAVAPFMIGFLRDATGSFEVGFVALSAVAACAGILAITALDRPESGSTAPQPAGAS